MKNVEQIMINGLPIHRMPSSFVLPMDNDNISHNLRSFYLPYSNVFFFKTDNDKWDIIDLGIWRANDLILERRYNTINSYKLNKIILTHYHFDHFAGVLSKLKKENPNIPISLYRPSEPHVNRLPAHFTSATMELHKIYTQYHKIDADHFHAEIDINLNNKKNVQIGSLDFTIVPTPGHSYDGCSFFNEEHGILISGDAIVTPSSTNSDNILTKDFPLNAGVLGIETSDSETMYASLLRISELPFKILFPGHGNIIMHEKLPSILKRDINKMVDQAQRVTELLNQLLKNMLVD